MLVYDDQEHIVDLDSAWDDVRARWLAARVQPTLDHLRTLLIASGALEQATEDALEQSGADLAHPFAACVRLATNRAARALHDAWRHGTRPVLGELGGAPPIRGRAAMRRPEGFTSYALFPEQYFASTWRWAAISPRLERSRPVLVIGVRSIGTTLSAAVAAALTSAGIAWERVTARPTGPPFDRHLSLDTALVHGRHAVLVVDEGPGLSGSSMVAVVRELSRHGVERGAVAFVAAHGQGPGLCASETARRVWNEVPCYATPVSAPVFGDRSLPQQLAAALSSHLGSEVVPLPDEDWRVHGHARLSDWPPMLARFVSPRYRVRVGHQLVAFEFAGLGGLPVADGAPLEAASRAASAGHAPSPYGELMGFVARPWVVGTSLRPSDANTDLLVGLARYVAAMAGEPLDAEQLGAAHRRRLRWTVSNLGRRDQRVLATVLEGGRVLVGPFTRRAFDYDPAPQRWTRTDAGLLKRNGTMGRAHPHTLVGPQPLLWDLAALICEWQLDGPGADLVVATVEEQLSAQMPQDTLRAFVLAYLSFKIGVMSLSRKDDGDESQRLESALAACEAHVDRVLSMPWLL